MIRTRSFGMAAITLLVTAGLASADGRSAPAKTPAMPITGPFSVQMFAGGTQYAWLCVEPPKTYADGTPIPDGKGVTIQVFQSMNGGKTYANKLAVASGGSGNVGQGKPGSQQKKWIDVKVSVDVDNKAPYVIYLAATATVDGATSLGETANLTFQYWPTLVRYADRSDVPGSAPPERPGGNGLDLCGDWQLQPGNVPLHFELKNGQYIGTIRNAGNGEALTLVGVLERGVYDFTWTIRTKDGEMSGSARLKPAADGRSISGTLRINGDNKSYPLHFDVDGRNLRSRS